MRRTVVVISVLLLGFLMTGVASGAIEQETAAHPEIESSLAGGTNDTDSGTTQQRGYYGFENESADVGVPDRFEAVTDPRDRGQTRIGLDEVNGSVAYQGAQSYRGVETKSGNVLFIRPERQPLTTPQTANVSVALRRVDRAHDYNQGKAGIDLYEQIGSEPNVRLHLRLDELTAKPYDTTITDVSTGEWVHVTIFDIDPANDTYSVEWETGGESGVVRDLPMNADMNDGYRNTVLSIDQEGYADALRLGDPTETNGDGATTTTTTENNTTTTSQPTAADNESTQQNEEEEESEDENEDASSDILDSPLLIAGIVIGCGLFLLIGVIIGRTG